MLLEELLFRVAEKDRDAFQDIYKENYRSIYGYAFSILKNAADTEEVVQDTFLRIWDSSDSYQSQGKPMAWIFTITRNLCYMKLREREGKSGISLEEITEEGEESSQIELAADKIVLHTILEKLKLQERQIVLLHLAGNMKYREIAAAMNLPVSTVLSKYHRSVKKMKKMLDE